MFGIENLVSFVLAVTLVILVPGPATLYVVGRARASVSGARHAVAGIIAGDLVLITLSGFGVGAVVSRWPVLLSVLKIVGALYVAWLGIVLLRSPSAHDGATAPVTAAQARDGFRKGLLITLTNPKPLLFFGAFFPMFIAPGTHAWQSFYVLGALFEVINLVYFATLILAVATLRRTRTFARFLTGDFNQASGIGLLLCSAMILATVFY